MLRRLLYNLSRDETFDKIVTDFLNEMIPISRNPNDKLVLSIQNLNALFSIFYYYFYTYYVNRFFINYKKTINIDSELVKCKNKITFEIEQYHLIFKFTIIRECGLFTWDNYFYIRKNLNFTYGYGIPYYYHHSSLMFENCISQTDCNKLLCVFMLDRIKLIFTQHTNLHIDIIDIILSWL